MIVSGRAPCSQSPVVGRAYPCPPLSYRPKAAGGNVRFTIYPEAGHDSWIETYNNPEFYASLFAQKTGRTKYPPWRRLHHDLCLALSPASPSCETRDPPGRRDGISPAAQVRLAAERDPAIRLSGLPRRTPGPRCELPECEVNLP
jgi:hypothetical protein